MSEPEFLAILQPLREKFSHEGAPFGNSRMRRLYTALKGTPADTFRRVVATALEREAPPLKQDLLRILERIQHEEHLARQQAERDAKWAEEAKADPKAVAAARAECISSVQKREESA